MRRIWETPMVEWDCTWPGKDDGQGGIHGGCFCPPMFALDSSGRTRRSGDDTHVDQGLTCQRCFVF